MQAVVRVAAAQFAVPPFDTAAGVEKVCEALAAASHEGVEVVVFPETFLGGYPYWRGHVSVSEETELAARLWEVSVIGGDAHVETIARAVIETGVGAVVGASERDARPGSGTAFNAQLFFTPGAGYVGSHRKLVPTHTERAYWGAGSASDLRVVDYPSAAVGGLICYEHHILAARIALALAGEEIHCAAWPGYWETGRHIADKVPGPARRHGEIDAVVRDYALSTQSFVVSANAYLPPRVIPSDLAAIMKYNLARGGSAVVDPSGRYLAGPVIDEETLLIADCDPADRAIAKAYLDTVGHYARWDIFEFRVRGQDAGPTGPTVNSITRDGRSDDLPSADPFASDSVHTADSFATRD
ncbi:MAG: nitrilase-related carbon-nitrogen hydrolase [Candidatus Limnocylindria bacterium]